MATVEPIRNKKDIQKVEKILAKQGQRELLLFVIGTNCGLRISDILNLNVADVKNKTHIQIVEKKTGKFKKFPINSKLKPIFQALRMIKNNQKICSNKVTTLPKVSYKTVLDYRAKNIELS